jgi:hypothetical protein
MIRVINATSPPGVHISFAEPVQDLIRYGEDIRKMVLRILSVRGYIVPLRPRRMGDCTCRNRDLVIMQRGVILIDLEEI